MPEYTPTERRLLGVLSDGERHTYDELIAMLPDPEMSTADNLQFHIAELQRKLKGIGQDINCVLRGRSRYYQQIRRLTPSLRQE